MSKVTLDWLIRQSWTGFKQLKLPRESADYKAWRQQFLWRRLGLCLWVAIFIWCCATVMDLYYFFYLPEAADIPQELKSSVMKMLKSSIMHDVATAALLLTLLMLYKTKLGHRYAGMLFLCLSWCATLLQEVFATINGFALGNDDMWRLMFMAQAILIPVRPLLHLVSQLGVLVYHVVVNSALGLTHIEGHSLYSVGLFLMIFWFCLICDLGVYLYERLQRVEFESRRELQLFLHAISHDLRTPLMGTSIVLQNLLKKLDNGKVTVNTKVLDHLLEGNSRQISLINALQEAYSLDVHGVKLHCQPLQVSTVVTSVLSDLEPLIVQNRITVNHLFTNNLPLCYADAVQLRRVFSNLISNALKHNPYEITLTVDATVKGKKMLCSVHDNGVGMSQQQCDRVFELYTRGKSARLMPGLGLGLYVCRQIITAHGGQVGVTSYLGAGSTFWFTLPLYSVE